MENSESPPRDETPPFFGRFRTILRRTIFFGCVLVVNIAGQSLAGGPVLADGFSKGPLSDVGHLRDPQRPAHARLVPCDLRRHRHAARPQAVGPDQQARRWENRPAGQTPRRRHPGLQRGQREGLRPHRGDLSVHRSDRQPRVLRFLHPQRHPRPRPLGHGGNLVDQPLPPARRLRPHLLPPPQDQRKPQGRQHRRLRPHLGRRL